MALPIPAADQGRLQLYVLAGQSNMSGRAPLPPDLAPEPGVYVLGNDYRWRTAVEPVDDDRGQIDLVSAEAGNDRPGYGPSVAFARALRAQSGSGGAPVGLIPCARGGSSLSEWRPAAGDDTLYGACLKRIGAALPMGELAGIFFYQGEADAIDPALHPEADLAPQAYGERLRRLVSAWRADLGRPDLPFVFAQIGSQTEPEVYVNWSAIQAQQAAVAIPCAAMVTTADLPLGDGVHLTRAGYDQLGARFAAATGRLRRRGAARPRFAGGATPCRRRNKKGAGSW